MIKCTYCKFAALCVPIGWEEFQYYIISKCRTCGAVFYVESVAAKAFKDLGNQGGSHSWDSMLLDCHRIKPIFNFYCKGCRHEHVLKLLDEAQGKSHETK